MTYQTERHVLKMTELYLGCLAGTNCLEKDRHTQVSSVVPFSWLFSVYPNVINIQYLWKFAPCNFLWYSLNILFLFVSHSTGWQHPAQGQPYRERYFTAYLPNNSEGQNVCQLLKRAFDAQLLFTIGKYQATGEDNQIVCNGIEHKIYRSGGAAK